MSDKRLNLYSELVQNLEDQIKIYRALLTTVRKEKEILVSANLDDLNENNRAKEAFLVKIQEHENLRLHTARALSEELGLNGDRPRLMDIAKNFEGDMGEKLRSLHSVLELLLKRVQEFNKQNEALVQSALQNITGAMKAIKETLTDKPTYKRQGGMAEQATGAGQLVSKEA
jgi:hypothetical protein